MAKAEKPKRPAKPNKKDQYERFQQTARDLGIDEAEGAEAFERAFEKIVPPKQAPSNASPKSRKMSERDQ
jgi:hypothetical protein